jgi:hypothetical protein
MKFTLEIELGNAAMRTAGDIAGALAKIAGRIDPRDVAAGAGGAVLDVNGNTVGRWEVTS